MNLLAFYNFRIPGQSMTLTRIALAACMLSSKKHADNISQLICKSDFDKLKGKEPARKLDEILHTLWAATQNETDKHLAVCQNDSAPVAEREDGQTGGLWILPGNC